MVVVDSRLDTCGDPDPESNVGLQIFIWSVDIPEASDDHDDGLPSFHSPPPDFERWVNGME